MKTQIIAYFDGACEPNPGGTAAFGAVVLRDNKPTWHCSELYQPPLGRADETSNNVVEYSGLLAILEYLLDRQLNLFPIVVRGDSKLVIEQMFGTWTIRRGLYVSIALKAKSLLNRFPLITGEWIPRERNGVADELSKRELIRAGVEVNNRYQNRRAEVRAIR